MQYFLTRWQRTGMSMDRLLRSVPRSRVTSPPYWEESRWTEKSWGFLVLLAGLSKKIAPFQCPLQAANTHAGSFGREAQQMSSKFRAIYYNNCQNKLPENRRLRGNAQENTKNYRSYFSDLFSPLSSSLRIKSLLWYFLVQRFPKFHTLRPL